MKIYGTLNDTNNSFFAEKSYAETGEDVQITLHTKDNTQKSLTIYKNNEVVYNGLTDNTTFWKYTYTCTGKGVQTFTAKVDDTLISDNLKVIDAFFVGTMRHDGWYDSTSFTINNVSVEDNTVKWVVPITSKYLGYRNNSIPSDFRGKTIKTTVKVRADRQVRLQGYSHDGNSWVGQGSVALPVGSTEKTLTFVVPSNSLQLWIRLQSDSDGNQLEQGEIVCIDKWVSYFE